MKYERNGKEEEPIRKFRVYITTKHDKFRGFHDVWAWSAPKAQARAEWYVKSHTNDPIKTISVSEIITDRSN